MKSFASDNNSGAHPAVMQAVVDANAGHCVGYGDDDYTRAAQARFRELFGEKSESFFVFLGTGANVLAIKALTRPWDAVLCAPSAHLNVDECGAPENIAGCKVQALASANGDGKITVKDIAPFIHGIGFEHHSQPKLVSITQCTELGSLYTLEEIRALADFAHEHSMYLHMDGARIANAVAAMGLDAENGLRRMTLDAGVDVLSFGGTKNGMLYGEAVVFMDGALAEHFKYIRKQGMQLASKMRYISAQFSALLEGGLWLENARQANAMARLLADRVTGLGVKLTRPVETNAVFATLDPDVTRELQKEHFFYVWDAGADEVRWMASFDTTAEDVDRFADSLKKLL